MMRSQTLRLAVSAAVVIIVGTTPAAADSTLSGAALSGSVDYAGHTLTWATSGASPATGDLAGSYDGVVPAGATVTFSGSATFSLGPGVTNLSQSASLSGAEGVSFSQRVGQGTYTLPYSLTTTAVAALTLPQVAGLAPSQLAALTAPALIAAPRLA